MNLFKRAPTRRPLSCPLCKTSVLECLSNRRHATDPPSQRARRGYHICVSWSYKFRGWPEKCKHDGVYQPFLKVFSASCSKLKSTFKNQFLNYIFHVNHGFNYTKRNGLLELHDRFVCKCINFFFCSSKICTVLFYRFWLKNLKNCVQDVLKKLLPAPKLDLRRYIRKQCLLGIKKEDTERQ